MPDVIHSKIRLAMAFNPKYQAGQQTKPQNYEFQIKYPTNSHRFSDPRMLVFFSLRYYLKTFENELIFNKMIVMFAIYDIVKK